MTDPNVQSLMTAAKAAEIQKFELHIRSIDPGHADQRLVRHTAETWWGDDAMMPTYRDKWTQGLWIGWKAKADSLLSGAKP